MSRTVTGLRQTIDLSAFTALSPDGDGTAADRAMFERMTNEPLAPGPNGFFTRQRVHLIGAIRWIYRLLAVVAIVVAAIRAYLGVARSACAVVDDGHAARASGCCWSWCEWWASPISISPRSRRSRRPTSPPPTRWRWCSRLPSCLRRSRRTSARRWSRLPECIRSRAVRSWQPASRSSLRRAPTATAEFGADHLGRDHSAHHHRGADDNRRHRGNDHHVDVAAGRTAGGPVHARRRVGRSRCDQRGAVDPARTRTARTAAACPTTTST